MSCGEPRRQGAGGDAAEQRGRPEPPTQRRVPPAHVDDARIRAVRRALSLDDGGARQPQLVGYRSHLTLSQMQNHRGMTVPGGRRPPEGGLAAALDQRLEPAEALDRGRDRDLPLVQLARVPDPHRVGAEVVAVLARGLPVHHVVGEAAGPALDVRLARELHRHPDQLIGDRQRQPVVVRHEVVARPPGGAAERGHALGAALLLDEGDQPLGEDAVDLARHRPLPPACSSRKVTSFAGRQRG